MRVPPQAPEFDRPLEDRVITEKSAVMFETEVSGFPDPKLEFFLKGKPLTNGVDGVTIEHRDSYYRVTIQNCTIDGHDGEILARATNQHGQAECRARLIVEQEEEESRSAPTFIKDIEDQTVKFGETAVFETSVRGSPNPTVSWFINGQQLDKSAPGVTIESSGTDHTLRIDSSKYAGTVLCRAENPIGRFETKARLIVLPAEKKKKAPEFIEKLSDKSELEGNTAVFEVTVDAEPKASFKWTLDGKELVESEVRACDLSWLKNVMVFSLHSILLFSECTSANSKAARSWRLTTSNSKRPDASNAWPAIRRAKPLRRPASQ